MSLAVVVGRKTSEQKTNVIEEVNRLKLQEKIKHDGTLASVNEHEQAMEDITQSLTNAILTTNPNDAKQFEKLLDGESNYIVSIIFKNN